VELLWGKCKGLTDETERLEEKMENRDDEL